MEWRDEILKGISVLPKVGVPGRIIVYGKQVEPILTGSNEEDVLVAAAEFGKGRIVAISHDGYASKFLDTDNSTEDAIATFHTNLKQWLTKGTYEKGDSIISAKEIVSEEKLMSSKIVIFEGGFSAIPLKVITEYVRNGGALLHCFTPWGWLQLNEEKTLSDVPYANLLNEVGIYYTEEFIDATDDGFNIKDNKANDAHLCRVLEYVGTDFDKGVEKLNMLKGIKYLPKEQILHLDPTSRKILENCREDLGKWSFLRIFITILRTTDAIEGDRAIVDFWLLCYDILQTPDVKVPIVSLFPGDFSTEPQLKCNTVELASDGEYFNSTACYLPAGQTLKVEVVSGNEELDWELMIGCHADVPRTEQFIMWPVLTKRVKLTQKTLEVSTPFGGLIYFIGPDKPNRGISVKLENVVDVPRFRLTEGEKGRETWEESRRSPGLWTDIEGELVRITLLASNVNEMEFDALTSVMKTWDSVVRLYHDLRGTDVSKFRRIWIVTDFLREGSDMHSGRITITDRDAVDPNGSDILLNDSNLQRIGNWGVFHKIGHTMKRDAWTFEGTVDVTANIFTLCAMDEICHLEPWIHEWLQYHLNDTETFLKDGADFETWKSSPGIALFVYAQLAHEFGWGSYRKVFRRYEAMDDSEKPKDNQMKIDMWFSIFSKIVGFNLSPLAIFWGIPISDDVLAHLQIAFPFGFVPDDEVTSLAPDRVDAVLRKFPDIVRRKF